MTGVLASPLPGLTEDQLALFAGTAEMLAGTHPERRAMALVELGVPVMLAAREHGGLAMGPVELVGVAFELGQQAEDTATLDMAIAAAVVSRYGEVAQVEYLCRLANGDERWTVRLPRHVYPNDAATATRVLYEHGGALYLAAGADCVFDPQHTIDPGRNIARISYHPRPDDFVTRRRDAITYVNALGAVTYSGYLAGLARRMLVDAVEHANSREQFGVPIGSFQAVAHRLADTFVLVDSSVVASFRAAADLADGDDRAVAVARAYCGDAVRRVTVNVLQVFGGIGFTEEHHLHRWLKRAKALESAFGAPHEHRSLVAQAMDQRERVGLSFPRGVR